MALTVKVESFDGYTLTTYSDGTYGYATDAGDHKEGYKSKDGAKKAAKKLADKIPKIIKSEEKDGYTVNTWSDGTYGYLMPDGSSKNGYKSKDGAKKAAKKLAAAAKKKQQELEQAEFEKLVEGYTARISEVYAQAVEEMTERLEKAAKGQLSGVNQKQQQALVEELSKQLVDADKLALQMANDMAPLAYASNFNYGTWQVEKASKADTSFTLYDESTVRTLIKDEPDLLPQASLNVPKDQAWNRRKLTSAVAQSILQGESIARAAARLRSVAQMGMNSSMRAARTMLTGAQNLGRIGSYARARELSIGVKKQWLATLDRRTRATHRRLDGEVVDLEEKFSNGLKYPGDPYGEAGEVYNCRCTLIPIIDGVDYEEVERASKLGGMTYDEWKKEKLSAEGKATLSLQEDYMRADTAYKALQARLVEFDDGVSYTGIWKEPVMVKDWEAKQEAIPKKIAWYEEQIEKAKADENKTLEANYKEFIELTKRFDEQGREYKKILDEFGQAATLRNSLRQQMLAKGLIADTPYSEERKLAALMFKSARDADKAYRSVSGAVWSAATEDEKRAIFRYTEGSGQYNRPLSGFQKPWSKPGSGWEQEWYKGVKNVWIDYEDMGDAIRKMTDIISRSTYDEDAWFVRGCGYNAMSSFFGVSEDRLRDMTNADLQKYVGTSNRIMSFVSTGVAEGTGFTHKSVSMRIYAPAGSEMMYAEPFSKYSGASYYLNWDGKKTQKNFGSEAEMILQRGGMYTVTKIEKDSRGRLNIELELHPEQGYDKFQQDPNEWSGSKEKYK